MNRHTLKIFFYACIFSIVTVTAGQARDITLQWDASTDPAVTGYKLYYNADSANTPLNGTGAAQGASPYNTKKVTTATLTGLDPNRPYYFAVTAYNASGTESSYSNVVNVSETAAPTVSISSPASNATISGTVSVTASAADNVGVTKVEFYVNGVLKTTDTSTPYLYSLNAASLASGTYTLMAKAYDAAGNVGQSSNVSVKVVNDTTVPAVSLTAPANNSTVSGTTTITANASDNVGVSNVEFYRSGVLLTATNVAPYKYSWNTATVADGSYTLTAKAYDNTGNVTQSSNIVVKVNNVASDSSAPTVAVTAPVNNAIVSGTTKLTATATDNVAVAKVEFYVNNVLQNTATAAPYSYSWDTTAKANGSYTLSAKAYDAANNAGQSSAVTVSIKNSIIPAGSIWADTVVPGVVDSGPDSAVELGVKFRSDSVGYISGIRFYKASTNTGTHIGNLWDNNGKLLATATFAKETSTGWQQVNFPTPVAIAANTVYVASYHTNVGHYSNNLNYFSGKGVDNPPLHALADGASGYSGVYAYGSTSSFPAQGWNSSNYWVDVAFTTSPPADTTAPVVAISSPSTNSTVSGTVPVSATASDNVGVSKVELYVNSILQATDTASPYTFSWNSTTLANGSYTLSAKAYDAAGNVGQSSSVSVSVNKLVADTAAPVVAIVSPLNNAIFSGTSASVTVSATDNVGVSKVEFFVNGALQATDTASPYTFTWNIATLANGSYTLIAKAYDAAGNVGPSSTVAVSINNSVQSASTIWDTATSPALVDSGPDGAVELGVKIRSDVSGYITGVRFYKAAANTGTHVANLWSSTGRRLATATFTNESASGWQQVNFSKPVAIKANTVYVASYHTNVGHYSDDLNYFAGKGVDNAPLHALADGVSGYSGVYSYGSSSKFPSMGWKSSNYWVDVVFKP